MSSDNPRHETDPGDALEKLILDLTHSPDFQRLSTARETSGIRSFITNQSVGLGKQGEIPSLSRKGQSPGSNRRRKLHRPEMDNGVA